MILVLVATSDNAFLLEFSPDEEFEYWLVTPRDVFTSQSEAAVFANLHYHCIVYKSNDFIKVSTRRVHPTQQML